MNGWAKNAVVLLYYHNLSLLLSYPGMALLDQVAPDSHPSPSFKFPDHDSSLSVPGRDNRRKFVVVADNRLPVVARGGESAGLWSCIEQYSM